MGVGEVEVPLDIFASRVQPFGVALAEVSWRVKMFTYDGVVLSALHLVEPEVVVAMCFWPETQVLRQTFQGRFELCLTPPEGHVGRVRLDLQIQKKMVEELFQAAELVNPYPSEDSACRARKYFEEFLVLDFPDAKVEWGKVLSWHNGPGFIEVNDPIRVG